MSESKLVSMIGESPTEFADRAVRESINSSDLAQVTIARLIGERDAAIEAAHRAALLLNQAATVREMIDIIELSPTFRAHSDKPTLCHCEICAYVRGNVTELRAKLAIPSDQLALDRLIADKVQQAVREAQLKEHYEWPSPPFGSEDWTDWAMHLLKLSKNDSERIAQLQAAAGAPEEK